MQRQSDRGIASSKGTGVSFFSSLAGTRGIYTRTADGSDEAEMILLGNRDLFPLSWSPDGSTLLFLEIKTPGDNDILVLSDRGVPVRFLSSPSNEQAPVFSPDGHYIAYVSDDSGQREVYVRPYPAGDQKWSISTNGGTEPIWSRDGQELFYRQNSTIMVADVCLGSSFKADRPRRLFEAPYVTDNAHPAYDIAPDGQCFLIIKDNEKERTQLNVVINWFEELKANVASR